MTKSPWHTFTPSPKEDKSIKDYNGVRRMKQIKLSKGYDEDANRDMRDYRPKQEGYCPDDK